MEKDEGVATVRKTKCCKEILLNDSLSDGIDSQMICLFSEQYLQYPANQMAPSTGDMRLGPHT